MNILIPIFAFGKGGGNRVLSELSNYWIMMGHNVSFICLNKSIMPYFPTKANIYWVNNEGDIVDHCLDDFKKSKSFLLKDILQLKKAINLMQKNYHVILANQSMTSIAVSLAKTTAKKFYYIQADEADYHFHNFSIKNLIMGMLIKYTYKLPLIRIVNSPIYFNSSHIKAKYYVPPGVDFNSFFPNDNNIKIKTIGCIGRFEKFKGTIDVFEAFKRLIDDGYDFNLNVAYGEVKNIEDKYREHIKVFQPQNDRELGEFYRNIDILISPGKVQFYAHHYPVMEAMASKKPVITTGYLPADRSNSWIVGPDSPDQIVNCIKEIISNKELVKKKVDLAFQNINYYSWNVVSSDFLKIFEKYSN